MAAPLTILLCGGGIRSLVAAAWLRSNYPNHRLALMHFKERRSNQVQRLEFVHRQARHWSGGNIVPVLELELDYRMGMPANEKAQATGSEIEPRLPLFVSRMLLHAMVQAEAMKAQGLIWPVQSQGDPVRISRATEQMVLVQGLVQLEGGQWPTLQMPLLELSDRQLAELGGHLQVPWQLAWSCQSRGIEPCKACIGCRRRAMALQAAGLIDPFNAPTSILTESAGR